MQAATAPVGTKLWLTVAATWFQSAAVICGLPPCLGSRGRGGGAAASPSRYIEHGPAGASGSDGAPTAPLGTQINGISRCVQPPPPRCLCLTGREPAWRPLSLLQRWAPNHLVGEDPATGERSLFGSLTFLGPGMMLYPVPPHRCLGICLFSFCVRLRPETLPSLLTGAGSLELSHGGGVALFKVHCSLGVQMAQEARGSSSAASSPPPGSALLRRRPVLLSSRRYVVSVSP